MFAVHPADTLAFRKAPVFKNSQVAFTVLTILGGVLADFAPLALLGEVSTTRCQLFPTWLLVATTLLYGPLVLKTYAAWLGTHTTCLTRSIPSCRYRVWKIMDNPSLRNVNIPVSNLLALLGVCVGLELVLALICGLVSPVRAETYLFSFSDYASLSRERCQDQDSIFTPIAYALVAVPLLAAIYLAFKTRRVTGNYTENKPILAAFYTLALAALVVIPMTRIFGGSDIVFHFVLVSIAILMVSSVSVFAFMVPKVLYHRGILVSPTQECNSYTQALCTHMTDIRVLNLGRYTPREPWLPR